MFEFRRMPNSFNILVKVGVTFCYVWYMTEADAIVAGLLPIMI